MDRYREGVSDQHNNYRSIFKAVNRPLLGWEITAMYLAMFHKRYSDSSTTARLREMPDVWCNLSTHEYNFVGGK